MFMRTLILFLLVTAVVWDANADPRTRDKNYVLPDRHFVERQCDRVKTSARGLREAIEEEANKSKADLGHLFEDQIYLSSAEVRQLRGRGLKLCSEFAKRNISGDEAVVALDQVLKSFEYAVGCQSCLAVFVPPDAPVPVGYPVYVTAIFTSREQKHDQDWFVSFFTVFANFGHAIGDRKLAVWLGGSGTGWVDIERGKLYADRFGLDYNHGPYIVVTSVRPDLAEQGDEIIYLRFGGIDKDRVIRVMNRLEQDLRRDREISGEALIYEEVKQRFFSSVKAFKDTALVVLAGVLAK